MKSLKLCGLFLAVCAMGCGKGQPSQVAELYPGISESQLAPTLNQIAQSGDYQPALMDLTVGLEKAGFMDEAARIQSFSELSQDKIKQLAAELAQTVERTLKSHSQ